MTIVFDEALHGSCLLGSWMPSTHRSRIHGHFGLWERFAFYAGTALYTSICLESHFRISLNECKAVRTLLNESEVQILEARALQYSLRRTHGLMI